MPSSLYRLLACALFFTLLSGSLVSAQDSDAGLVAGGGGPSRPPLQRTHLAPERRYLSADDMIEGDRADVEARTQIVVSMYYDKVTDGIPTNPVILGVVA